MDGGDRSGCHTCCSLRQACVGRSLMWFAHASLAEVSQQPSHLNLRPWAQMSGLVVVGSCGPRTGAIEPRAGVYHRKPDQGVDEPRTGVLLDLEQGSCKLRAGACREPRAGVLLDLEQGSCELRAGVCLVNPEQGCCWTLNKGRTSSGQEHEHKNPEQRCSNPTLPLHHHEKLKCRKRSRNSLFSAWSARICHKKKSYASCSSEEP